MTWPFRPKPFKMNIMKRPVANRGGAFFLCAIAEAMLCWAMPKIFCGWGMKLLGKAMLGCRGMRRTS